MKNQNVARVAQLESIAKKETPMEIQICHEISNGFVEILKEIRKQEKQVINNYAEN